MDEQKQLVLILVDGLRPDGILQADTPVMDALMESGAYTLTARTVMPSVTLPCHMSLFLGVRPSRHGITTNLWTPQVRPVAGLFEVLAQAGLINASFYNWEELRDISRPGALEASYMVKITREVGASDTAVAHMTADWLKSHDFHFAFIYLGETDVAGHDFGWMSEPYLQAISHADACIGTIIAAIPQDCAILVTSDHGGHEQSHGTDSDEDMTIPLIVAGPPVEGIGRIEQEVEITDIAPTIARYFGVRVPLEWIGKPIQLTRNIQDAQS